MTPTALITKIDRASSPEEAFGKLTDVDALTKLFRAMARVLHPDRCKVAGAAAAMAKLTDLRERAEAELRAGTYGTATATIRAKQAYSHVRSLAAGDICDVYLGDYLEAGRNVTAAIKIARDPRDADLLQNEARALAKLRGDATFSKYVPRLIESARIPLGGKDRPANVLSYRPGGYTLGQVIAAYPAGVEPRAFAWMWRRMLEALSWAHDCGLVHGAVLPEHVVVRPDDHGAKLIDWTASVKIGEPLRILSPSREAYYPPEVAAKLPATAATDIYMAAACGVALLGGDVASVPRAIDSCLRACLISNPRRRTSDVKRLYREFDDVLRGLYGTPKFHPFEMPEN